jgi:hypothetical protein
MREREKKFPTTQMGRKERKRKKKGEKPACA